MTVHSMFLTLQLMDKYNPARKNVIERMIQTALGAEAARKAGIGELHGREEELKEVGNVMNEDVEYVMYTEFLNDLNVVLEIPAVDMNPIGNSGRGLQKTRREVEDHEFGNVDVKRNHDVGRYDDTEREENWDGPNEAEVGNPSIGNEVVEEGTVNKCDGREEDDEEEMIVKVPIKNEGKEMKV